MKELYLVRDETGPQGTWGVLVDLDENRTYHTIEPPWKDNLPFASCVPEGGYLCRRRYSRHFAQWLYELCDVPGRSGILFHSGNLAGDRELGYLTHTYGCILLGKRRGILSGQKAVLLSRLALGEFDRSMPGDSFYLHLFWGKQNI